MFFRRYLKSTFRASRDEAMKILAKQGLGTKDIAKLTRLDDEYLITVRFVEGQETYEVKPYRKSKNRSLREPRMAAA